MKNRNSLGAKSSRFILKGVGLWSNKDVMEYAYSVLILVHEIPLRNLLSRDFNSSKFESINFALQ